MNEIVNEYGLWYLIIIISSLLILIFFWKGPNAVWGGLTAGFIIGLIIAVISAIGPEKFYWVIVGKSSSIGIWIGFALEVLPRLIGFKKSKKA